MAAVLPVPPVCLFCTFPTQGQEDVGSTVMHKQVQVAVSELRFSQVPGAFSRMLWLPCGVGHCSERVCHCKAGKW